MDNETYNGWTNWDTWAANLWLTSNDESTYLEAVDVVDRDWTYEPKVLALVHLINDVGNPDEIDYSNVNWQEVIEGLRE